MIKRKGSENMKRTGRGQRMWMGKSIILGCLSSIVVTMILLCAAAYLEVAEIILEKTRESIVIGIQFISTSVGCIIGAQKDESNRFATSLVTALGYFLFMSMVSIIFLNESLSSIFQGILAIVLGAFAGFMVVCSRKKRIILQRKRMYSR